MEQRRSGRFIHRGQRNTAHSAGEPFPSETSQRVQWKRFLVQGKLDSELNANLLEGVKGMIDGD